jgi:hypothetical protein
MEVKCKINKYTQDFNEVGGAYRGLTNFIIVGQCISFSWENK